MYSFQTHQFFRKLISFLHAIGVWHQGNVATVQELIIKWFYCIYYSLFVLSLAIGAIRSENGDEAIFLMEIAIIVSVLNFKLGVLIWKQKQILMLLNRIGSFSINNDKDAIIVNDKIGSFMKFVRVFLVSYVVALFVEVGVVPLLNSENVLFFEIAFLLDWKHNKISFWIANLFLFTEVGLCLAPLLFAITVWYLMLICCLRYKVLEGEMRNMGRITEEGSVGASDEAWYKNFSHDLKSSIDHHLRLRELVDSAGDLFFSLFCIQFGTGSIFICGSVYCLAFNVSDNLVERVIHAYILLYNISEIFMITYLGNEIMLSSDRLTYGLFESDWIDQPQSTRKSVLIFGEYLKQPHQLLVAKLYPLNLVTFTAIVRSAFSMFNILKNLQQ